MSLSRPFLGDITKSDQNTVDSKKVWTVQELIDLDGIGAVKVTTHRSGLFVVCNNIFSLEHYQFTLQKKEHFFKYFFEQFKEYPQQEKFVFFSQREDTNSDTCPNFNKCFTVKLVDNFKEDIIQFTECTQCFTLCQVGEMGPFSCPSYNIQERKCIGCFPVEHPSSPPENPPHSSPQRPLWSPIVSDSSTIDPTEEPNEDLSLVLQLGTNPYTTSSVEVSPRSTVDIPSDYEPASPIYNPTSPLYSPVSPIYHPPSPLYDPYDPPSPFLRIGETQ